MTGCCPKKCDSPCMIFNAIVTAVIFYLLWWIGFKVVDTVLENGYSLLAGSMLNTATELIRGATSTDDIANDIDETCGVDDNSLVDGFIWINYDMDVADYLTSTIYNETSITGLVLGIMEVVIILRLSFCLRQGRDQRDRVDSRERDEFESRPLNG